MRVRPETLREVSYALFYSGPPSMSVIHQSRIQNNYVNSHVEYHVIEVFGP